MGLQLVGGAELVNIIVRRSLFPTNISVCIVVICLKVMVVNFVLLNAPSERILILLLMVTLSKLVQLLKALKDIPFVMLLSITNSFTH